MAAAPAPPAFGNDLLNILREAENGDSVYQSARAMAGFIPAGEFLVVRDVDVFRANVQPAGGQGAAADVPGQLIGL